MLRKLDPTDGGQQGKALGLAFPVSGPQFPGLRSEKRSVGVVPKLGCIYFWPREIFKILTPSCTSDGINLGLGGGGEGGPCIGSF